MFTEFSGIYEKSLNWLRLIGRSEIRIKVLILLIDGAKNIRELRGHLNLPSPTILHAMRGMEDEGLIENTKGEYSLTNIGMVQAIGIRDLADTIAVLFQNKNFWLNHDISGIPFQFLKSIGVLADCEFVKATPDDLLRPLSSFVQLTQRASELKGVFSVVYPGLSDTLKSLLENGAEVEFILTRTVFEKVMEGDIQFLDLLMEKTASKELKLWIIDDDPMISFGVTDSVLSFSLFLEDGTYDTSTELVSYSDEALRWGKDLIKYYIEMAKAVEPNDIKNKYVPII
ncbi:MAG: winged helix-turn-helix domain-containing protein [Halobacteriota archaeon]|nr:winged helix-turn-helix domain-containing protein [Halobacteriota archaeon]